MNWSRRYEGEEPLRVNKWLAQAGVCSRREAEGLIAEGRVTIDGERVEDVGRKILPGTETVDLTHHVVGEPLKREYHRGFIYSDGWVDDARLVVLNAVDAAERGASIRTRTRLIRADRQGELWQLVLNARGKRETVTARALVNAAGAWVPEVADHMLRLPPSGHTRLVKGSHIVVPRLYAHDHAYIFQNADGRIVFAIPYEGDYTLIGTTDEDFHGDLSAPARARADSLLMMDGPIVKPFTSTSATVPPEFTCTVPKLLSALLSVALPVPVSSVSVPAVALIAPFMLTLPPAVASDVAPPVTTVELYV